MTQQFKWRSSASASEPGHVGSSERLLSALAGVGLSVQALRTEGALNRVLLGLAGATLLSRSATGYCAIKSALSGNTGLRQGLQERTRRLRHTIGRQSAARLDSMSELYASELQELHSAETQLADTIERLAQSFQDRSLSQRLDEYVAELRTRRIDLDMLLARSDIDPRAHPDDAMRALLNETRKMARISAPSLRDAALIASLQRIIHYKIAGYGTIAAYAKALGRTDQAQRFAEWTARDRKVDEELTGLAKTTLNPQAASSTEHVSPPGSMRTH